MSKIEFTQNYSDLSTNQGFQFEFYCDRCGSGFRTRFQPSTLGTVSNALDAASSLFGGILGRAADLGERARSATWEKAHDENFIKAMEELKPDFVQCPRCSSWICRESCWNVNKGFVQELRTRPWGGNGRCAGQPDGRRSLGAFKSGRRGSGNAAGEELARRRAGHLSKLQCATGWQSQVLPGM